MAAPPRSGQFAYAPFIACVGMWVRAWLVVFIGYTISYIGPLELEASTDGILVFFFVVPAMRAKTGTLGGFEYSGADTVYTRNGRDRKADEEWKKGKESEMRLKS